MRLIFRFYLFLVVCLLAYVGLSDWLFESQDQHDNDLHNIAWLTAQQIEAGTSVEQLSQQLNLPLKVLPLTSLNTDHFEDRFLLTETDHDNQMFYLHDHFILSIGVPKPTGLWRTSLFYLAMILIIAIWFWPLLGEVKRLNQAIHITSSLEDKSPYLLKRVRYLAPTARKLEQMRSKILQLISDQKILTSAISHEMRTPLARMKFALAFMPNSSEKQSLLEDVDDLEALIDAMLQYARIDQYQGAQPLVTVDVVSLVQQVIGKQPQSNRVQLLAPATKEICAQVEPTSFSMAISNLIANALRHSKKVVEVNLHASKSQLVISISDDGEGVAIDDREKVFTAFTRLDNSRNKATGGYGLGLAIVRRIAQRHQGSAWVEGASLGGAKFCFSIPQQASLGELL